MILGDANCGKTSLVTRFAQGYYHPNLNHRSKSAPNSPNNGGQTNARSLSPTSSLLAQHRNPNFVTKSIPVTASNIPTKIQIWDVAGVPNNSTTDNCNSASASAAISNKGAITAAKCYYSTSSAILLGYDVTSRSSYDGMRSWLNELRSSAKNNNSVSFNNVVIAIVALKIDLLDDYPYKGGEVVPEYEVEQLAQTLNVMYIPTSAKLDINVMSLFSRVAEEVLERRKQQREGGVGGGIGGGGGFYNGGTTLTGATTSSTAYEKKGSDANDNNNGDNINNDNDHRDDYDDVTDKNGNDDDDDGTNQFGKRKRSSSGCAPASAVFGMMGRGKEEENGGILDGNNNGNMMEEDMNNDDGSLNDGEKKKKDGDHDEDDDQNTGSFFMMCGNTTWCGNTADIVEG